MAKYYYCPLFSSPSASQPGSTPSRSSYSPGLFDAATGITTSAVAAMGAAGVDFSYRTDSVTGPIGIVLGTMPGRSSGTAPSGMASSPQVGPPPEPPPGALTFNQANAPLGTTLIGGFPPSQPFPALADGTVGWPGQSQWPNVTPAAGFMVGGEVRMTIAPNMVPRALRSRNCILYLDTTSGNLNLPTPLAGTPTIGRMVIETADAFVDGPFLALGWLERTPAEVNADYPYTIQPPIPQNS